MIHRRTLFRFGLTAISGGLAAKALSGAPVPRLLFVHGRDQQGKDPKALTADWLGALKKGAKSINRTLLNDPQVSFPFYGDVLDGFAKRFAIPLTSDIQTRGEVNEDFLSFQAEMAEALRTAAGVTDAQIDQEYGPNPRQKGPLNWEWVQAILRAVDKHGGGLNSVAIERFTRDVFLYTRRAGVRDEIDKIVADRLTTDPTVIVAHSLGSVVTYNVLRSDRRALQVPLLVTVGSPLGIRAIRDQLRPLRYPQPVTTWYNAFDPRDVVALYPLDATNFAVTPSVQNAAKVNNHTGNRHGIVGYLDDPGVVGRILDALAMNR